MVQKFEDFSSMNVADSSSNIGVTQKVIWPPSSQGTRVIIFSQNKLHSLANIMRWLKKYVIQMKN